ncbi:hypothetical protein Dtox_2453 [Desulfofarcimen acetoxidans DSM 771]|uniref:Uncharacterized protein n=1 Tax=Desulfofarcimen acetoxidans (strain ATCC 49208 / DSM 771 / KCTC 5769 / VKM B-1644 / 5575) TaxID=485916 RepID=C8W0K7_DESAS|nr:hypothetical protein [Desulfofarcimen acetoxidans]ACV63262.1 hypothetical protein Dtox_2453 [Desulfofarcimen acetoxidans DSM 771]
MTEEITNSFLTKVDLQAEINRLQHGNIRRSIQEWSLIIGTHFGHLFNAVRRNDHAEIEKEILHITAPLLEMYQENVNAS